MTLHDRARAAGLQPDWTDASGRAQRVSDEALEGVLAALAETDRNPPVTFVSGDLDRPIVMRDMREDGELRLADGERRDIRIDGILPPIDRPGYHQVELADRTITVAVAPPRCRTIADAGAGRIWGPAVQIPALRDARSTGFGDFTTLATSARAFAAAGAQALAISPVHALFPADPTRYSPYAPSSRLFLNILYADPGNIDGEPAPDLIEWAEAIPERLRRLRAAFDARPDAVRAHVAAFTDEGGDELIRHARFDALHTRFGGGWQNWPADYHDPAGDAVQRFAAEHADEVGFYLYCQWLADRGLSAAQDNGMAIGLITDLAVGMDAGGSHAWSRPDDLLTGLNIGAPPDLLGPAGQDWGITGFSPAGLRRTAFEPFIATIRAALRHAGGIRIDHAMGLQRLWVVPQGASPKDGAYLEYPLDDMLRILAIESQAAGAIVIGEDLGTVPEGFREKLDERAIMGMRVMPFETEDDRLKPPGTYDAQAAAMTGTHDLATVAGWWSGRDIAWNRDLGRFAASDEDRAKDRTGWWNSFVEAGVASGDQPAPDDTAPAVTAALAFIGRTPCDIAIVPMEDLAGLPEQPNLPGTTTEHPNWRRRMPADTADLLTQPHVAANVQTLQEARRA